MTDENQSFEDIIEDLRYRYPSRKYASKYPELFSKKFENFCDENIVPIFRRKLRFIKSDKHPKYLGMKIFGYTTFSCLVISFFLIPVFQNLVIVLVFVFLFVFTFVTGRIFANLYFKQEEDRKRKLKIEFEKMEKEIFPVLFSFGNEIEYISNLSEKENLNFLLYRFHIGQLYGGIDTKYKDDFFKIKYKKLEIEVREVFFKKVSNGYAVVFSIETYKEFSHRTAIIHRNSETEYNLPEKLENYERVNLEDAEFNNIYKVLTTSQQEARLFITPAFMSRLVEFQKKYPKFSMDISFERNNINILFYDAKDRFELFKWDDYMSYKDTDIDMYNYDIYRTAFLDLREPLYKIDELQIENIL